MTGTFSPDDSTGGPRGPRRSPGRGRSRGFPFDPVTSSRSAFTETDADGASDPARRTPMDAAGDDQSVVPGPRVGGSVVETPAVPVAVPAAAHLEAYEAHLRYERALSPHTVRAYLGDVTTLLDHLRAPGRRARRRGGHPARPRRSRPPRAALLARRGPYARREPDHAGASRGGGPHVHRVGGAHRARAHRRRRPSRLAPRAPAAARGAARRPGGRRPARRGVRGGGGRPGGAARPPAARAALRHRRARLRALRPRRRRHRRRPSYAARPGQGGQGAHRRLRRARGRGPRRLAT